MKDKKESAPQVNYHLVVKSPFLTYGKGDMIKDSEKVLEILSTNEHQVIKVKVEKD